MCSSVYEPVKRRFLATRRAFFARFFRHHARRPHLHWGGPHDRSCDIAAAHVGGGKPRNTPNLYTMSASTLEKNNCKLYELKLHAHRR